MDNRDTQMLRNEVEAVPEAKPPRHMPLLVFLLVVALSTLAVVLVIDL